MIKHNTLLNSIPTDINAEMRVRTESEKAFRDFVDNSNLTDAEKVKVKIASAEFGKREMKNGLEVEMAEFIKLKLSVAKELLGSHYD